MAKKSYNQILDENKQLKDVLEKYEEEIKKSFKKGYDEGFQKGFDDAISAIELNDSIDEAVEPQH